MPLDLRHHWRDVHSGRDHRLLHIHSLWGLEKDTAWQDVVSLPSTGGRLQVYTQPLFISMGPVQSTAPPPHCLPTFFYVSLKWGMLGLRKCWNIFVIVFSHPNIFLSENCPFENYSMQVQHFCSVCVMVLRLQFAKVKPHWPVTNPLAVQIIQVHSVCLWLCWSVKLIFAQ